jgi:predicted ester cyclase
MSCDQNKRQIVRYFSTLDAGPEATMLALIDELVAEDYVAHTAGSVLQGREGLKQHARGAYATFTDMRHTIEDNLAEGDKVVTRARFRAIQRGEFLGIAPSGRQIECPIIYVHRFAAGHIQEAWLDWDSLTVVAEQLRRR